MHADYSLRVSKAKIIAFDDGHRSVVVHLFESRNREDPP